VITVALAVSLLAPFLYKEIRRGKATDPYDPSASR
jgi:hypothetical protein